MINYRSVADLDADARRLAQAVGPGVDVVVGIPRSGLLAANLLCLHVNCPMTDVDGLLARRLLTAGRRLDDRAFAWDAVERVLVVDDSVNTGREMRRARDRVARADLPFAVEFAAVYVSPGAHGYVDHHVAVVPTPRLFGWNLFHHPSLRHCCVVADGLLWRRPAAADLADAAAYRRYLATADPLTLPTKRVGWVVTDRAASDREATATWLDAHGVAYDRIVTLGRSTTDGRPARTSAERAAAARAAAYESTDARLLIEPSAAYAAAVVEQTRRPVYCHETDVIVGNRLEDRVAAAAVAWVAGRNGHVVGRVVAAAAVARATLLASLDRVSGRLRRVGR